MVSPLKEAGFSFKYLFLAFHKRDIGKQCRSKSEAADWAVWLGSTLFTLSLKISTKHDSKKTYQTPLIYEMDLSKELWKKSSLGINGLKGEQIFTFKADSSEGSQSNF